MTDSLNRAAAKEQARHAAAFARQHAKYRPANTALPHQPEPAVCLGCGGTLSRDEHQTHPACEVPAAAEQQETPA